VAETANRSGGPDRFLIGIVAGVLVLTVVGVVVAAAAAGRTAPPPDPESPAGVVDRYVAAVRSGDREAAEALLTRAAREAQRRDLDRAGYYARSTEPSTRIALETTAVQSDTATVRLTVSRYFARSGPFQSNVSSTDYDVRLLREDGTWKISQPPPPYALY